MAQFEGYERREAKILAALKEYGISSIDECKEICDAKGIDPYTIVQETQPICFENAKWAYTVGAAIAIKAGCTKAADAAAKIGIGLQSFCIPGSVAENRKVGLGHGNLGKMLLSEETECFCFLAGHESFAAAEGAIKIALNANKVRQKNLRVILNGLGKDAAYIISRINGFTYCETEFDPYSETVTVTKQIAFSNGPRADVKCYGADNVPEGVAIMKLENVGVSITGNSTNPTRFQHPVAGTYKKWCVENGVNYFSVASGISAVSFSAALALNVMAPKPARSPVQTAAAIKPFIFFIVTLLSYISETFPFHYNIRKVSAECCIFSKDKIFYHRI